ncbi:MAG TPA: hypothetical protein VK158_01880 [Acidobacteriota bacterium]|nr:hypothetical protein [Acidobacteriota bacterium]
MRCTHKGRSKIYSYSLFPCGKKGDFFSVLFIIFATILLMTGFMTLSMYSKKVPQYANIASVRVLEAEKQLDFVVLYMDSVVRQQFLASQVPVVTMPRSCMTSDDGSLILVNSKTCALELRATYTDALATSLSSKMGKLSVGNQLSPFSKFDLTDSRYFVSVYPTSTGGASASASTYQALVWSKTPLTIYGVGRDRKDTSYDGSQWSVVPKESYLNFAEFNDAKIRYSFFIARPYERVSGLSSSLTELYRAIDSYDAIDTQVKPLLVNYLNSEELTDDEFVASTYAALQTLKLPTYAVSITDVAGAPHLFISFSGFAMAYPLSV